jgi:hypothetical protein
MRAMTKKGLLKAVAFLLFAPNILGQSNAPARALSDSTRRVVFDGEAFFGEGQALPRWSNGYLVARRAEIFQAGVPNIRVYDQNGHRAREAAVWFPGSQRILIYSVAIDPNGQIVAGGAANKADGTQVPFISLSDGNGKLVSALQTIGFAPRNICIAPDATMWSFGGTGYDGSQPKPGDTLRHFDLQKGQIGSYLPRSTFSANPPDVHAQIQCSAKGIIVYSASAATYIEMKYGEASPHVYGVAVPPQMKFLGFATISPDQVYAYFSHGDFGGLYYLAFDESGKPVSWHAVKGAVGPPNGPGVVSGLWGAEGDELVVSRGDDSVGVQAIHWTRVVNR